MSSEMGGEIEHSPLADLAPGARRALLAQLLRAKAHANVTTCAPTYGQRALWYIDQLAPEATAYNVGAASRMRQPLDITALTQSLQALVDRHSALRTTFAEGEHGPVQQVRGALEVDLVQVDARGWDDDQLVAAVTAALHRRFDLAHGPLLRTLLFTRAPADHVLLCAFHHIVTDGWSTGLFLGELETLYATYVGGGSPTALAPHPRQYAEYAQWQAAMLAGPQGERLRTYWLNSLRGELPQLDLPIDHPRPQQQTFRGASLPFALDEKTLHALRNLAHAEQATPYVLFLAAYQLLLYRLTGQSDIIVGTPLACRAQADFQATIGYFANAMPQRSDFSGALTFHTLMQRTRTVVLDTLEHQEYPFALLVEQLKPPRNPGRAAVFEATFNYMRATVLKDGAQTATGSAAHDAAHLHLEPFPLGQEAGQFDLSFELVEYNTHLHGVINYNTDILEASTVERMAAHYHNLLRAILANPNAPVDALPLLSAAELNEIAAWNATDAPYPAHQCLHELVAAQAARTPDAIALRSHGHSLTYAALERRANQLAHHLCSLGVLPGALVGVYLERSLDMVVALLGVLKAGAAYVPMDPGFPAERIAMMLEDSAAPLVLTQQSLVAALPASRAQTLCLDGDWAQGGAAAAPLPPTSPDSLAYVIFTSGSTGRPKGVQIPHRAVVNFLTTMALAPGLHADDVLAAVTTLSFDIAVLEIFLPLVVGAQSVIISREAAANGNLLAAELAAVGATVMQATPSTWRMLIAAGWRAPAGFRALCGGEALPPALAHSLLAAGADLWNMYGPTETTVWSAVAQITDAAAPIVIGRPIANTQLHILNRALQPCPVGVVGELWIGGDGLAHGYLNRPDLTAERFVTDPFRSAQPNHDAGGPPPRIYCTGDLARRLRDGAVEVLGRTDHQVKIRGYRIELGEIEVSLLRHAALREAVVVARDDGRGAQRLVAYIVAAGAVTPQAGELRLHLRATLPDYMIPSAFVPLEALPRTPNGKIDRRALPAPDAGRTRREEAKAPPATATEKAVATVWRELLETEQVGLYDNFFDLGGHSLLAMEALSKLERTLGARLQPALLRAQTLGQVAASYDELLRAQAPIAPDPPAPPAPPPAAPNGAHTDDADNRRAGGLFGALKRAVNPGGAADGGSSTS